MFKHTSIYIWPFLKHYYSLVVVVVVFINISQYIWKQRGEKIKLQDKNQEQNLEDLVTAWLWKIKKEESNFTLRLLVWLIEWKILLTKIENRR